MADSLQPVPIQELRLLDQGRRWLVDQMIPELETLVPVRGSLQATHRGNVLEVQGEVATIVTLCCDRCLQAFNHPLQARNEELLWLGEGPHPEVEDDDLEAQVFSLDPDTLGDQLDPRGLFDPQRWVFEQLSLQLPLVNRCGDHCPGPPAYRNPEPVQADGGAGLVDPRWQALEALRPAGDPES
ncbi:MAG: YceD family protein [Cyanobacteriota bacterium]